MFINLNLEYLGIVIFILISCVISVVLLLVSYLLSSKKPNNEKLSAYECGFEPFSSGSSSFDVHFYLVGILFLIFDLELVFLYPYAIYMHQLGFLGFLSVMGFLAILTVGFIYE